MVSFDRAAVTSLSGGTPVKRMVVNVAVKVVVPYGCISTTTSSYKLSWIDQVILILVSDNVHSNLFIIL